MKNKKVLLISLLSIILFFVLFVINNLFGAINNKKSNQPKLYVDSDLEFSFVYYDGELKKVLKNNNKGVKNSIKGADEMIYIGKPNSDIFYIELFLYKTNLNIEDWWRKVGVTYFKNPDIEKVNSSYIDSEKSMAVILSESNPENSPSWIVHVVSHEGYIYMFQLKSNDKILLENGNKILNSFKFSGQNLIFPILADQLLPEVDWQEYKTGQYQIKGMEKPKTGFFRKGKILNLDKNGNPIFLNDLPKIFESKLIEDGWTESLPNGASGPTTNVYNYTRDISGQSKSLTIVVDINEAEFKKNPPYLNEIYIFQEK